MFGSIALDSASGSLTSRAGFVASGPITFCVYLVALQHLLPIYGQRDSKPLEATA